MQTNRAPTGRRPARQTEDTLSLMGVLHQRDWHDVAQLLVINNRGSSAQGAHFPNLSTVAKLVGTTVTKMDDHKDSSSGAKMPSWKKNFPYQAWEYETRIYAEYRGLDHVLKKENKPSGAPEHKPLATTKETFMAKVQINDGWMATAF